MTTSTDSRRSTLRLLEAGEVYRNPLPGHQALAVTHSFMIKLPNDELLISYKCGQAMYARDNIVNFSRSTDGGKTWKHEGPFHDRSKDDKPYQYSAGNLTLLKDGSLIMNNWRCDRSDPHKLWIDPDTGSHLPVDICFYRSTDGGRTWSDKPVIGDADDAGPGLIHAWGGPVIEMDSGRWMHLSEPWIAYGSKKKEYDIYTYVMFSDDQGKTWSNKTDIANGVSEGIGFSHGHIVRMPSGKYLALYWTMNQRMTEFYDLSWNMSTDATATKWTKPVRTGIPGQSCYPVILDENRWAVIYSERGDKQPGIKVVLTNDGGKTWDVDKQVCVWDAYGKEALGVPRTDKYPGSHDAIAYGAPHLCQYDEKTLVANFWCTQSADTHTRFARVAID